MSDTRYVESATVATYALRYGDVPAAWAALTSEEKDLLVQESSEDLDRMFGDRWKGRRATKDQVRDHPRSGMVDRDGYTMLSATTAQAVKDATCELALLKAQGLFSGLPTNRSGERIKSKAISAKGVSKSVTYAGSGSYTDSAANRTYPKLEAILRDVLRESGTTVEHVLGVG